MSSDNFRFARDGGFIFNVIWPPAFLYVPWAISVWLVFILSEMVEEKPAKSKHPTLSKLILAGVIIIVAGIIYGRFHPGFIQTLLMQARR